MFSSYVFIFFKPQTNTFQGIIVTDFSRSFSVFTYYCGDMSYSNGATIGFMTRDGLFANHPAGTRTHAEYIDCLNDPISPWVNIVYQISQRGKFSSKLCEIKLILLHATVPTWPYISLGVTENVTTHNVQAQDDGLSEPIDVQFAFGNQIESTVYVSRNS